MACVANLYGSCLAFAHPMHMDCTYQEARMLKASLKMTTRYTDDATRLRVLMRDLRELRRAVDRLGAADIVHTLHNAVLTAQGALGLVEARLHQGRTDEVAGLLQLAEQRLRACRTVIARRQQPRVVRALALSSRT